MKSLYGDMAIVSIAFLLLIMVLPEPGGKKRKYVDVLFFMIRRLQGVYNHENHTLTKIATEFALF